MAEIKPISMDNAGFPVLREALLSMLNQFPGLDGDKITYQELSDSYGICMAPDSSPVVITSQTDIVGGVHRTCQFAFLVVYRTDTSDESQKLYVSKFLDDLAAWVCQEPVDDYSVAVYPDLTGGRTITGATRSNVYAFEENENKTQDWAVSISVNYTHDYTRRNYLG